MKPSLRRILTARPVDLPIYRQYVIDHPKHVATGLIYMLPWSVTVGIAVVLVVLCVVGGK